MPASSAVCSRSPAIRSASNAICSTARRTRPAHKSRDSVLGELDDARALGELARSVDVLTLEIENVAVDALEAVASVVDVFPPPSAVAAAQDRLAEKTLFGELGIPTVEFVRVDTDADLDAAAARARLAARAEDAALGLRRARAAGRRFANGPLERVARARRVLRRSRRRGCGSIASCR